MISMKMTSFHKFPVKVLNKYNFCYTVLKKNPLKSKIFSKVLDESTIKIIIMEFWRKFIENGGFHGKQSIIQGFQWKY